MFITNLGEEGRGDKDDRLATSVFATTVRRSLRGDIDLPMRSISFSTTSLGEVGRRALVSSPSSVMASVAAAATVLFRAGGLTRIIAVRSLHLPRMEVAVPGVAAVEGLGGVNRGLLTAILLCEPESSKFETASHSSPLAGVVAFASGEMALNVDCGVLDALKVRELRPLPARCTCDEFSISATTFVPFNSAPRTLTPAMTSDDGAISS